MENLSIDMNVVCAGSGEQEKITILFGKHKDYDPDYESETIKYIKSTGVLNENDVKLSDGYIITKGSFGVDTPMQREYAYRYQYIHKRDEETMKNLENEHFIPFGDGIRYDAWREGVKDLDDRDYVLACSYADLHFVHPPMHDHQATFRIRADHDLYGFTLKELATKTFKYFEMMYQINLHYNMDDGKFQESKLGIDKWVFPSVFEYEFYDNGIEGLEFIDHKWLVTMSEYI